MADEYATGGYSRLAGGDYIPSFVRRKSDPCRFDFGIKRKMDFFFKRIDPAIRGRIFSSPVPDGFYWWLTELSGDSTLGGSAVGLAFFLIQPNVPDSVVNDTGVLNFMGGAIRLGSGESDVGGAGDSFILSTNHSSGTGEVGAFVANRIIVPSGWRVLLTLADALGLDLLLRMSVLEIRNGMLPPRIR